MNRPVTNQSKVRRKFDRAFKEEAVNNWLNSGKPASSVAEELGITASSLYNWRKEYGPAAPSERGATTEELNAEVMALRRELDRVRQQRDILKKTLGILSEPPNSGSNASTH